MNRGDIDPRPCEMPIDHLLVAGRDQTNRTHLKNRLLKAGLKKNRCERCGITEWQGQPLSMQLHHINGDGKDNRLGNLELLCGNCHSQTPNYGGGTGTGESAGSRRSRPRPRPPGARMHGPGPGISFAWTSKAVITWSAGSRT